MPFILREINLKVVVVAVTDLTEAQFEQELQDSLDDHLTKLRQKFKNPNNANHFTSLILHYHNPTGDDVDEVVI